MYDMIQMSIQNKKFPLISFGINWVFVNWLHFVIVIIGV